MRVYDQFTQELARTLPFRIEHVDSAVTLLATAGARPADVGRWLGWIAQGKCTLRAAVRAAQLGVRPGDPLA